MNNEGTKKIAVFLAEGFEEIEAVTPIDLLRRNNIEVTVVSCNSERKVVGSHGIAVEADITLEELSEKTLKESDGVIAPGGLPGAINLGENQKVISIFQNFYKEKKMVAAICAAPALLLAKTGILKERNFTGYPGSVGEGHGGNYLEEESVVVDENLITSQGVGTAIKFSLVLIGYLKGHETARRFQPTILV